VRHPRKTLAVATAAAAVAATALLPSGQASAAAGANAASPAYQITIGAVNSFAYPDDTPASAYLDSDGSFHFHRCRRAKPGAATGGSATTGTSS